MRRDGPLLFMHFGNFTNLVILPSSDPSNQASETLSLGDIQNTDSG